MRTRNGAAALLPTRHRAARLRIGDGPEAVVLIVAIARVAVIIAGARVAVATGPVAVVHGGDGAERAGIDGQDRAFTDAWTLVSTDSGSGA